MPDTLPSSRRFKTFPFLIVPFLTLFFLTGSSFSIVSGPASRAENEDIMQLRSDITGYAQNFLGLRYRHGGTTPERGGFDCSGFTSYILKEFDVKVSSSSRTQSVQGAKIPLDAVLPGDLIFFGRKGGVHHVAMVVENSDEGIVCVHSTCSRGVIVENISTSAYWKPKIMFARDVISGQMTK
jgi:cell wall-associated NlpC family hydrolase